MTTTTVPLPTLHSACVAYAWGRFEPAGPHPYPKLLVGFTRWLFCFFKGCVCVCVCVCFKEVAEGQKGEGESQAGSELSAQSPTWARAHEW